MLKIVFRIIVLVVELIILYGNEIIKGIISSSDIDCSQSISDIDKQLYKKYNLSDDEIEFIETNVKEME